MRTSVIIVTYNSRADLETCLPSLFRSLSSQDEVIIVDNASTDDISSWLDDVYPQARLIQSSENLGYAGGNNLGARNATGEFLAFLNPDTVVDDSWLVGLITALEEHDSSALATSKILLTRAPALINTCGTTVHISGISLCRGLNLPEDTFQHVEVVGAVSGAAFAIRKDLFETIGGFDENFFMYMEDIDISWRAKAIGAVCLLVPSSVVWHDYIPKFRSRKIYYQERNRYVMLLKTLRWETLLLLLPTLLLAEIITWGFVILRDRANLKNKFEAYAWIIKNWSEIMEKRRLVQSNRNVSDRTMLKGTTFHLDFKQTGDSRASRFAKVVFTPAFCLLRGLLFCLVWR